MVWTIWLTGWNRFSSRIRLTIPSAPCWTHIQRNLCTKKGQRYSFVQKVVIFNQSFKGTELKPSVVWKMFYRWQFEKVKFFSKKDIFFKDETYKKCSNASPLATKLNIKLVFNEKLVTFLLDLVVLKVNFVSFREKLQCSYFFYCFELTELSFISQMVDCNPLNICFIVLFVSLNEMMRGSRHLSLC